MFFVLLYNFATRLGFPTVIVTYLALAAAHAAATPLTDLDPLVRLGSVALGLGAVVLSYRTLTVALPDCQLMALAASAFMAVLPGHVAAVSVAPGLALAELVGATLVFVVVRAVTRSAAARTGTSAAGAPLAVAAAGAISGVGGFFATFWLPEAWAAQPMMTVPLWALAAGTVAAFGGAGLYWRAMALNQAGLTVPETEAFKVFYAVAGLGIVAGTAELALSPAPRGTVMYPVLASLALIGIVGFESWFPALIRPLVVFAVLVGLLALNIVGLLMLGVG